MKYLVVALMVGAIGFVGAYGLFKGKLQSQQDSFAKQQAAWLSEKEELEAALANTQGRTVTLPGETKTIEVAKKVSPAEIMARLRKMKVAANQPRAARLLVHQFENLTDAGPAALPVIRDFIASNEDVDYDSGSSGRNGRSGKMPLDFNVPPTLRLGLFEVAKNIGGKDAEGILAEAISATGRGVEVAYLAQALEAMSPGKYRDVVLLTVHALLARATDNSERNYLLSTLAQLNDASFATTAQAQLIQPDGKVDVAALRYIQQTQPDKSLAIAIAAYLDPRVTDGQEKARLAQVALDTAGADPQADQFVRAALVDTTLPADSRRNLAEDFADHGTNPKNPSPRDLQIMQNRMAQLDQLNADATDPLVIAGLAEAKKDLTKFINNYAAQHPQK